MPQDSTGADDDGTVNPHYLDHLVAAAEQQDIDVTEDVVSGNGIKLLARGAKVSPAMRERLLQHKLLKPLEHCLGVGDGISGERIAEVALSLLERHALLQALCEHERAQPVSVSLRKLPLSGPLQSLLTVYAKSSGDRLAHAVGVALAALGLARRLLPGDIESQQLLARAGLLHDVGELYLRPDYLRRDGPLQAEQWQYLVSHPVIGHRVLRDIEGGGAALADLVLTHHERLDGFGYPQGLHGGVQLGLQAQILAASEWLMGLIESGASPVVHASIATKLIPGEFAEALLEVLREASVASAGGHEPRKEPADLADALRRAMRVATVLKRFRESGALIEQVLAAASPALQAMLALCLHRLRQLQSSFSSAGLDAGQVDQVFQQLAAERGEVKIEVISLVREFGWRLRELEREALRRSTQFSADDQALLQGLIATLKVGQQPES